MGRDTVTFKGATISRQRILDLMARYDRQYPNNDYHEPPTKKGWLDNNAYKYAVLYGGKRYPPKYLVHLATGRALQGEGLKGGQVNRVFEQLAFDVVRK